MCVANWQVTKNMGLKRADLLVPALTVSVADNSSLELIGAQFVTIFSASGHASEQLVYFATGIGEFYLSKASLIDLQVISKDFPRVGAYPANTSHTNSHKGQATGGTLYEVQDGFPSVRD